MKMKVQIKQLKEIITDNDYILKCDYNNLYYLLKEEKPIFYYANKYGWQCDIYLLEYIINDTLTRVYIISGYDKLNKIVNNHTYKLNYLTTSYYNDIAKDRINQYVFRHDNDDILELQDRLRNLTYDLISTIIRTNSGRVL